MPLQNYQYDTIMRQYSKTQSQNRRVQEERTKEIYEKIPRIREIDEEVAAKAMKLAKKLAVHMKETLHCDGVNILQNNEETAGQTVFHFHMHVFPRYKDARNDDILQWTHEEFSEEEIKEILKTIQM